MVVWADIAAERFLELLPHHSRVLDIGSGSSKSEFARMCEGAFHQYVPFDWANGDDWESPALRRSYQQAFDGVWMSHSLEHMLDTHTALKRLHTVCKPGGLICITVPPMKPQIVGGHVSLWNAGMLLYRLVMAEFDCSHARVKTYGYNVSVILNRQRIELPKLNRDIGDIELLAQYFPMPVRQGFDGRIDEVDW